MNLVCKKSLHYLLFSCTNPVLGKNLIPEICAKMLLANQIAGFLNCLSLEQNYEKTWFFACWYKFREIKSWLKNIGVGGVFKNGCGHSGLRTLKLAVSKEGINEINWFLVFGKNSGKPKVTLIIFGWWW